MAALASHPSAAAEPATTLSLDGVGRVGPRGLAVASEIARRWPRDDGASLLARGRYVQVGAGSLLSPSHARASLAVEWVPVAPIQLRASYEALGFFGAFGSLLRLPSPDASFGQRELDALSGEEKTGIGQRVTMAPVLRARVGRVALRNQTGLSWYALSRAPGWYYESEHDTLVDESDWVVANSTALLFAIHERAGSATFLAGPTYDLTHATSADITRHRLGITAYAASARPRFGLHRVRAYALAGVNLADRNRAGQPFAMLGVGGEYDLAGRR